MSGARSTAAVLFATAVGALAARRTLVEVRGPSMEPTLWPGDRLVSLPARPAWLCDGQIVVLRDPEDPTHRIVKRLTRVDDGWVEVRGDDPSRSTDGRRWGPLPATSIERIVVARWPDVRSPLRRRLRCTPRDPSAR